MTDTVSSLLTDIGSKLLQGYYVHQPETLDRVFEQPSSGSTSDGGARLLAHPFRSFQRASSAVLLTGILTISPTQPSRQLEPPAVVVEEAHQQAPHLVALAWIEQATRLPLERIAPLLGIKRQTLYAWKNGAQIRSANQQRLFAVLDVLKRAAVRHPTAELLVAWLDMPRGADGQTPAQLLEAGNIDRARLLAISKPISELLGASAWIHEPVAEAFQSVQEWLVEAQPADNDAELAALWDEGDDEDESG